MKYLMAITIGPIQTQIQNAQKTKDLINSSKIPSDIIKKFSEQVSQEDIVYPRVSSEVDTTNFLLCVVSKMIPISDFTDRLDGLLQEYVNKNYFIFQVFEELEENNYEDSYHNLMKKLRSLKNTYKICDSGDDGQKIFMKKCKVCGVYSAEKNELCCYCDFRRRYHSISNIPSIYDVSLAYWKLKHKESLLNIKALGLFKPENDSKYYNEDFINRIRKLIDKESSEKVVEILKREEVYDDIDEKDYLTLKSKLNQHHQFLKELYSTISKPKYKYAIIQTDIDNLGKFMSGKYLFDKKYLKKSQIFLADCLEKFACALKNELPETAFVVYAGGDDLMILTAVEEVLTVADKIESVFNFWVAKPIDECSLFMNSMTATTSISIVPCKSSMAAAIEQNRKTLLTTKKFFTSKNGIGFNYIFDQGSSTTAYLTKSQYALMKKSIEIYSKNSKGISFNYIRQIENQFKFILKTSQIRDESLMDILIYEHTRRLRRSVHGETDELSQFIDYQIKLFRGLLHSCDSLTSSYTNALKILYIMEKCCKENIIKEVTE